MNAKGGGSQSESTDSEKPPYWQAFLKVAPWASPAIILLAVVAFVDNNFWTGEPWNGGLLPVGFTTEQTNAAIVVVALGLGAFVWAAAWPNPLVLAGVLISWFIGFGLWLADDANTAAGVTWAVCTTSLVAFIGVLLTQGTTQGKTITKNSMRNAITASFVLTYLVSVGLVVFLRDETDQDPLPPIAQQLVPNFTTLMGVVIAFYFVTAGIEKVAEIRSLSNVSTETATAIRDAAEE